MITQPRRHLSPSAITAGARYRGQSGFACAQQQPRYIHTIDRRAPRLQARLRPRQFVLTAGPDFRASANQREVRRKTIRSQHGLPHDLAGEIDNMGCSCKSWKTEEGSAQARNNNRPSRVAGKLSANGFHCRTERRVAPPNLCGV